jgi:radical SAM family uncharacterized protein/radical SAM-linked protein
LICGLSDRVLFRMFGSVTRPGRYLDHEPNLRRTGGARFKMLVCFPDLYEIAMSNLGVRILHHVVNRHPGCLADFAFAPWTDMQQFMKREGLPLAGIGTGIPAKDFDVVGFSLQHELQYTNVLAMLDLAGIPVFAAERAESDPIVIAGGPCAFNPEPTSDFIDAYVVGDGESAVREIADRLSGAGAGRLPRSRRLEILTEIGGVHVTGLDGRGDPGRTVARRVEPALKDEDFPVPPVVPIIPITHDRLTLEIMRGCTRGCRFCSAGMLTRPVRERSADAVAGLAAAGIDASGWEEVSLVSLSTSDYAQLESLVGKLAAAFESRRVGISLPSMRPGAFSPAVARTIARTKKTGLTFAPEAGSEVLRRRVNKDVNEVDIYSTVETAFRGGWDSVKLYFMVGLPGEDDSDILALVKMAKSVGSICRGFGKRRHATVSLSPFVPRPHTPLQWEAQCLPEETLRRINLIRKNLPDDRIKLKWRDPYMSLVEGLLARGDRRFGRTVLEAWRSGAGFDGWSDRFDFDLWTRCFEAAGIDVGKAVARREVGARLPWSYVSGGVAAEFLRKEADRAEAGVLTPDCRGGVCSGCGACPGPGPRSPAAGDGARSGDLGDGEPGAGPLTDGAGPGPDARAAARLPASGRFQPAARLRVKYCKTEEIRFISHLDVTRCFQRGVRRIRLPVSYSEGFSPHPRMSFGPPLPLGVAGEAEYFDVLVDGRPAPGWVEPLNQALPAGLRVLDARVMPPQGPSLMTLLNAAEYRIVVWDCDRREGSAIAEALKSAFGETGASGVRVESDGSECRIHMLARLKVEAGAAEKVMERVVGREGRPLMIIRLGLYLEKDGQLYNGFGELRKESK